MANYGKVSVQGLYSENSDYSSPKSKTSVVQTCTPDNFRHMVIECQLTAGSALDITDFSAIESMVVKNTHATATIVLDYTSLSASAAVGIKIPAGGVIVVTDIKVSSAITLTASVACDAEIMILGDK